MTIPSAGTPRAESRPNTAGKSRSCAAAIGTWPMVSVQPLSAPIDDSTTASAIAVAPHEPHNTPAASVKGETDFTSFSRGTRPSRATVATT